MFVCFYRPTFSWRLLLAQALHGVDVVVYGAMDFFFNCIFVLKDWRAKRTSFRGFGIKPDFTIRTVCCSPHFNKNTYPMRQVGISVHDSRIES